MLNSQTLFWVLIALTAAVNVWAFVVWLKIRRITGETLKRSRQRKAQEYYRKHPRQ